MNNHTHKTRGVFLTGFTILEMIVSLGVFSIALLISLGALLTISSAQKKAVAVQNIEDNFRFALEAISKEARTGTTFYCGFTESDLPTSFRSGFTRRSCSGGGRALTFLPARFAADNTPVTYRLRDKRIEKIVNLNETAATFLTSDLVEINDLTFYVTGAETEDGLQPRVTIMLDAVAAPATREEVRLRLQTSISQRLLDNQPASP